MLTSIFILTKCQIPEVLDKINLYVAGNDKLTEVVKEYSDEISKDTLANKIVYNAERAYEDISINGENFKIAVEKI